jgi:hypothetical protein
MKLLQKLKVAGEMRRRTKLLALTSIETRWTATYTMLRRYTELKPFLDVTNPDLVALLPDAVEELQLQSLLSSLKQLHEVTLFLQQGEGVSLAEVRDVFDVLCSHFPTCASHLAPDAQIIASPYFESAIVKIINGENETLTDIEKGKVQCFLRHADPVEVASPIGGSPSIIKNALRKRRRAQPDEYEDLNWIPPTSNICERLFSLAKLTLGSLRQSMSPETLEATVMLKVNRAYWNIFTVDAIVRNPDNSF